MIGFHHFLPVSDAEDWMLYVGAPGDVVNGRAGAGSVTAISHQETSKLYTQDSAGIPGKAEAGDHFGASLAHSRRAAP